MCTNLSSIRFEIGSRLESIGVEAFGECTSLTSISLPDRLVSIGDRAFYGDTNLTTVESTVYSRLESVGNLAFYQTGLTAITFNGPINTIGERAFAYTNITSVTFGVKAVPAEIEIGNYAFACCYDLTDETILEIKATGIVSNDTTFARVITQ